MSFVALQDFFHGVRKYSRGEVLPQRARFWAVLREYQRKGWVSRSKDVAKPEGESVDMKTLTEIATPAAASKYFPKKRRKG